MGMFQLNVVLVLLSVAYVVKGSNDRCYSEFSSDKTLGCFADNPSRILRAVFHSSGKNSVPLCRQLCKERNYALAGVQYSKECFCGNNMVIKNKRPDHECNMKCSGSNEKCGGGWRMNVFSTDGLTYNDYHKSVHYAGCYVDYPSRLLGAKSSFTDLNSIQYCINFCKAFGYSYAGVEYTRECFCDNAFHGNVRKATESDCNMKCKSSESEKCGGGWRISVYKTANTPTDEITVDYKNGCDSCKCVWENSAFQTTCTDVECPTLQCKEKDQQEGECCPTCKEGCYENLEKYEKGETIPSSDKCESCTCEEQDGSGLMKKCYTIQCDIICPYGVEDDGTCCGKCIDEEEDEECVPEECPLLQCVDPIKEDGSCCYTCPNGQTCMYKGKVVLPNKQESFGKNVCMCGGSDNWHLDAYCRKKKVDKKNYKSVKKFKDIIAIPQE